MEEMKRDNVPPEVADAEPAVSPQADTGTPVGPETVSADGPSAGAPAGPETVPADGSSAGAPAGLEAVPADMASSELSAELERMDAYRKNTADVPREEAAPVSPAVPPIYQGQLRRDDDDEDDDEDEREVRHHRPFALLLTLVILAAFFGGAYYIYRHYADYFRTHFYAGTMINGVDVSYRTVDDVKQSLANSIAGYSLTIEEMDGQTETLTGEEIGWAYVDNHQVDEAMAAQDTDRWILDYFERRTYEIPSRTTYSKEKVDAAIDALACLQEANTVHPADARLVTDENGLYAIEPEVEGNEVNKAALVEQVYKALDEGKMTCSITEPDCYNHPSIRSDDAELNRRMNGWNKLLDINVSYEFGPNVETINTETVRPYISDNGHEVTISTDWIRPLVYEWGQKYDTFGLARKFTTHSGVEIDIAAGGDYGWCINKDKTIADVTEAVLGSAHGTRQPIWLFRAMGWDNGDITGTYVEVSIAEQKLWCYKNYELVMETDVVTGLPSPERETKTGIFAIDAKKPDAVLGRLDVQGYASPVKWWAPFNGGQGLHDAPWRSSFGGNIYESNGSHGCVNIPEENMETIYNAVSIGTAVIVY